MSGDDITPPFLPDVDPGPTPADALELAEDTSAAAFVEQEVVVDPTPDPIGRSWYFDFIDGRFVLNPAKQPIETSGDGTLRMWIEKCLRTPRGSYSIHPSWYGIDGYNDIIGSASATFDSVALEEKIVDALLEHPRITSVEGFDVAIDEDAIYLSFAVAVDGGDEEDGSTLTFREFSLA